MGSIKSSTQWKISLTPVVQPRSFLPHGWQCSSFLVHHFREKSSLKEQAYTNSRVPVYTHICTPVKWGCTCLQGTCDWRARSLRYGTPLMAEGSIPAPTTQAGTLPGLVLLPGGQHQPSVAPPLAPHDHGTDPPLLGSVPAHTHTKFWVCSNTRKPDSSPSAFLRSRLILPLPLT